MLFSFLLRIQILSLHILLFITAHFVFITAHIGYHCTLKLSMDYHSNYPEVCLLRDTSSNTVISNIKSIFARFRIPKIVVSDNGPQFESSTFKKFASDSDFQHVTSSPKHPRSNGMAENAVKVVQEILLKTYLADEDSYLALLAYRSTPNTNDLQSSADKLLGRPTRTNLPDLRKRYPCKTQAKKDRLPTKYKPQNIKRAKMNFDRGKKILPEIPVELTVCIQENDSWPVKGRVVKKTLHPDHMLWKQKMAQQGEGAGKDY